MFVFITCKAKSSDEGQWISYISMCHRYYWCHYHNLQFVNVHRCLLLCSMFILFVKSVHVRPLLCSMFISVGKCSQIIVTTFKVYLYVRVKGLNIHTESTIIRTESTIVRYVLYFSSKLILQNTLVITMTDLSTVLLIAIHFSILCLFNQVAKNSLILIVRI